jgi:hypothetical protein
MKDEDQTPRQIGLCCAGEMFLTIVGRGAWSISDLSLDELSTLYELATKAGRVDAQKHIQRVMRDKLPFPVQS